MPSAKRTSPAPSDGHALDLQRLEFLAQDLINDSLVTSTKRVYATGQRRYLEFCKLYKLTAFPATKDQLVEDGLQHSSIKGYLSTIRRLQIVKGLGDPFSASWPLLEYMLRGIKLRQAKRQETRPKKRLPITPDILRKLRATWERDRRNHDNIMLWAASCTCFFGFLRSGEVTVPSMREYDPEGHLSEGDVALDSQKNPSIVRVNIKASKTDPFRRGVYVFLGRTGNELCPVEAVAAYLVGRG